VTLLLKATGPRLDCLPTWLKRSGVPRGLQKGGKSVLQSTVISCLDVLRTKAQVLFSTRA
jgi:hypothetical protein